MTRKILSTVIFFLIASSADLFATIIKVANEQEMNSAILKAVAGDEIVIRNGTYTPWKITVITKGAPGMPLKIRAETAGKVIFTGDVSKPVFTIEGDFTEITGIAFIGCIQLKSDQGSGVLIELKNTNAARLSGCVFSNNLSKTQYVPLVVISGKGSGNRVDHCEFSGNVDNQEVQIKITSESVPQLSLIDNNSFRDKPKVSWANANGGECIQIGQDPILLGAKASNAVIRDNKFVSCNGEPEVISNKSSGNSYIHNMFENCLGELVMRGGHDCKIDSNTIRSGSGGIRLNGTNHQVTNNTLSSLSTGIRLMYGMSKGKSEFGFYVAAGDCVIKNNTISDCKTGILIGDSKNADWTGKFDVNRYPSRTIQDVAPYNITLLDNRITRSENAIVHNEN